ncbi:MAG: hypothetical protein IJX15_00395 [Ruminiclostridium sp.]|nr:hypothetical protein [Ruminiclostridium sp.]MBQ8410179.1 hypothetical protein [Ruminiclostridium sp.]MBQ8842704.1 hypothetical protein [Ruminiclostridium sp.]
MIDYKSLYFFLFNGITDIIGEMEKAENRNDNIRFIQYLKILQAGSEELYLKQGDDDDDDGQT